MIIALACALCVAFILLPHPAVYRPTSGWPPLVTKRRHSADIATIVAEVAMRLNAGQDLNKAWSTALRPYSNNTIMGDVDGKKIARLLTTIADKDSMAVIDSLKATIDFSQQHGAPMADVLLRVAGSLHEAQQASRQRRVVLAGPRATARLLAILPLGGLALGFMVGVDPLAVFSDGQWGTLAALVGVVLMCVGYLWNRRLIAQAERAGDET